MQGTNENEKKDFSLNRILLTEGHPVRGIPVFFQCRWGLVPIEAIEIGIVCIIEFD